eukprot:COSAG01_NODE_18509_length_1071_cov_1.960905_2_plen_100_part_01
MIELAHDQWYELGSEPLVVRRAVRLVSSAEGRATLAQRSTGGGGGLAAAAAVEVLLGLGTQEIRAGGGGRGSGQGQSKSSHDEPTVVLEGLALLLPACWL